jgi:2-(1,2-epoxy-1,2-dihydrophenyl)acetyl-CoA isomerase
VTTEFGLPPLSCIDLERRQHVLLATLNRPSVLNAINDALRSDLHALTRYVHDTDDVRVLVLTGAGRGFCSGGDIAGMADPGQAPPQNALIDEYLSAGDRALAFDHLDKPVIAAVNGVAAGSGMSLALSCDLRVGDSRTRFRTAFVERALSPDAGMTYTLARIVGYARAADLLLTSRDVGAEDAYRLGLLDRVVPEDGAVAAAVELAQRIASLPPLAVRASKQVLKRSVDLGLEDALRLETAALTRAARATADRAEAFASFTERRSPHYEGR